MIEFIKENWILLGCVVIYFIQIGSVLKSQMDRLHASTRDWGRSPNYLPLPLWKLCLFMIPAIPILWFFGNISIFEIGRIFVRTWEWHKEYNRKKAEENNDPTIPS